MADFLLGLINAVVTESGQVVLRLPVVAETN